MGLFLWLSQKFLVFAWRMSQIVKNWSIILEKSIKMGTFLPKWLLEMGLDIPI